MKRLFAIVLLEPNEKVAERIRENYPANFKYSDTFFLVAVEGTTLSEDIATAVGIKGENRIEGSSGVVFKQNSGYAGYTTRTLWEWIEDVLPR